MQKYYVREEKYFNIIPLQMVEKHHLQLSSKVNKYGLILYARWGRISRNDLRCNKQWLDALECLNFF